MFSQAYACPETPAGAIEGTFDIATDPLMTAIFADTVTMGNLAYDNLNNGIQGDPTTCFPDWLGYPLNHDDTWNTDGLSVDYVAEQPTQDFMMPSPSGFPNYFPLIPSPPPSEISTPEHQQPALPPHEQSCYHASPFKGAKGKWSCGACGKDFRGHYECERHIKNAGRRATCLACNKKINGREDSLRRHYYRHCKRTDLGRDCENIRFEDAFVHV